MSLQRSSCMASSSTTSVCVALSTKASTPAMISLHPSGW
jgi:hypothetical protein